MACEKPLQDEATVSPWTNERGLAGPVTVACHRAALAADRIPLAVRSTTEGGTRRTGDTEAARVLVLSGFDAVVTCSDALAAGRMPALPGENRAIKEG